MPAHRTPVPTEQLLAAVVALRRAGRAHRGAPLGDDLQRAAHDLTAALAPTVGKAVAARAIGVARESIDRRITAGDLPAGRRLETALVLDIAEGVAIRRARGARRAVLHKAVRSAVNRRTAAARAAARGGDDADTLPG